MKFAWLKGLIIHGVLGCIITCFTVSGGLRALAKLHFTTRNPNAHTILGLLMLSLIFVVSITGIFSVGFGRFYHGTKPWSHHKELHNKIGQLHKYVGYLIIMFGIAACSSGIVAF